jgi:hypothetical protein
MPIIVKHNGKTYKIPDDVLARSAVPKERFEAGLRELEAAAAARKSEAAEAAAGSFTRYRFLDLSDQDFDALD